MSDGIRDSGGPYSLKQSPEAVERERDALRLNFRNLKSTLTLQIKLLSDRVAALEDIVKAMPI